MIKVLKIALMLVLFNTISKAQEINFSIATGNLMKNGNRGYIQISPADNYSHYLTSIDSGKNFSPELFFNDLDSGNYYVILKDDLGNQSKIVKVTIHQHIYFKVFLNNIIYDSLNECINYVALYVNAQGGNGDYDFELFGDDEYFQTSDNGFFENLSLGKYTLIVSDDQESVESEIKISLQKFFVKENIQAY